MGADEHAVATAGMPFDDEVFHVYRRTSAPVTNLEGLSVHNAARSTEVGSQQGPLLHHRRRTTRPRPQARDRLQVRKCSRTGEFRRFLRPARGRHRNRRQEGHDNHGNHDKHVNRV